MKNTLKQIFSFILPVTVLILVPLYIEKNINIQFTLVSLVGFLLIIIGLSVITLTISSFIRLGKGTLAPWSPTKKLVVVGMYAYVRNPMIMAVLIVLIGESIVIPSQNIFLWAIIFFIINNIYFSLYEEPNLETKFKDEYKEYKSNVHRWIPKLKPYRQGAKNN